MAGLNGEAPPDGIEVPISSATRYVLGTGPYIQLDIRRRVRGIHLRSTSQRVTNTMTGRAYPCNHELCAVPASIRCPGVVLQYERVVIDLSLPDFVAKGTICTQFLTFNGTLFSSQWGWI